MHNNGEEDVQFDIESRFAHKYPLLPEKADIGFEQEEGDHLRNHLHVLLRRKWIVLAVFISVVVTVTLSTFMMKPVYKSTATIRIDKENPNVLTFKDVYQIERPDEDYYQTQYRVLRSRNIAKRVIKKLSLDKHREFKSDGKKFSIRSAIFSLLPTGKGGDKANPFMEGGIETSLVDGFIGRLEVNPVHKSQLVKVSFAAHDPELSRDVANAIAETYIEFNIQSKFDATQQARKWLQEQIEIMKAKVEASEEKLNEYSAGNEMIFLDENKDKQSLLTQKLSELSAALSESTSNRVRKEALYREIQESGTDNPSILNDPLVQELKGQYASLEAEYSNLLKIYKPDYPKMKSLKSQMDKVAARIEQEKLDIRESIESDYKVALKRERYLAEVFDARKKEALDFQKKMVQYLILKREVDTNKELYNNLLQRLKEIGVSVTMTTTNIQILDRAELPKNPFKPRKSVNVLLSIIAGLMGGIGMAFFVEYLDNTVKDVHEIEHRMRLPTLGMIPFQNASKPSTQWLLTYNNGRLAEAFRSIGTFVQLSSAPKPPKSMLFTSPRAGEGKTTISANTAMALMESFEKGIIIDADLRKPRLHRIFEIDNSTGLSTFLSGNMESDTGLSKPTSIDGLHIITSGPIPPNPSALLGSAGMKDLLDRLYALYDFVIIDSPPVLGLTDSILLSSLVDGVILVVKAGQTPKNSILESKKLLTQINANILGVTLNCIRENDLKYGYYSYYYSSYYQER